MAQLRRYHADPSQKPPNRRFAAHLSCPIKRRYIFVLWQKLGYPLCTTGTPGLLIAHFALAAGFTPNSGRPGVQSQYESSHHQLWGEKRMCAFMGRLCSRRRQMMGFGASAALMIAVCSAEPMPSTTISSTPTTAPGARASSPADQADRPSCLTVDGGQNCKGAPGPRRAVVLLRTPRENLPSLPTTSNIGPDDPAPDEHHFRITSIRRP